MRWDRGGLADSGLMAVSIVFSGGLMASYGGRLELSLGDVLSLATAGLAAGDRAPFLARQIVALAYGAKRPAKGLCVTV